MVPMPSATPWLEHRAGEWVSLGSGAALAMCIVAHLSVTLHSVSLTSPDS